MGIPSLVYLLLSFCGLVSCVTYSYDASSTPSAALIVKDNADSNEAVSITARGCNQSVILEKEYVILENGSLLLPENNQLYNHDRYKVENQTAYICVGDSEAKEIEKNDLEYKFSEEFLQCGHILFENEEFKLLENRTLYIDAYRRFYKPTEYYLVEGTGAYVCAEIIDEIDTNSTNSTNSEVKKFSSVFNYVSFVGLLISIISLILHLIVFCCVSKVRNLPGYCLASLSLSLLLAYLCFLSGSISRDQEECARLGLSVYYFFLTSFFWMNIIAFDVWRSFRVVVRTMRITSHRVPWRKFSLYSAYCWLIPAALVVLADVADKTDLLADEFKPDFGKPNCWFGKRKALLVFFALPLCIIMFLNALFFLDSAYVINVATMKKSTVNDLMLRKRFFMFMRLALLMGLTWIIGIVAGYVNQQILWFVFVILNTLQGLFIFIVFSCSSKVRTLLITKLLHKSNADQGTSVRTISQMSNAL